MKRSMGSGLGVFAIAASFVSPAAFGCDICAVYVGTELRERRTGPWLGIAEQFTRFATLQEGGEEVSNPARERLESSITQIALGYSFHPTFGVQVNVPVISRSFRRLEGEAVVRGSESGVGDLSALARYSLFDRMTPRGPLRLELFAGFEAPTGDSDRLREELAEGHDEGTAGEEEVPSGDHSEAHHGHEASGVHGHDLALGSGSWDGLFGGRAFAARGRWFSSAVVQYAIRTEGDFDYSYADELTWSAAVGRFLLVRHEQLVGLQAIFSGETKGKDTLDGRRLDDTAITALYAGPGVFATWGASFALEASGELPILQHNSALQIVPDYRIRGGLSWRF